MRHHKVVCFGSELHHTAVYCAGEHLRAFHTPTCRQPPIPPRKGHMARQIKADINNKMDDRFSVMLTNPNCPEDLASDLTLHFKEQLKKRRKAL